MANEMMAFTTNKKSNKRYGTSEKHVNANQSDESVFFSGPKYNITNQVETKSCGTYP